MVLYKIQNGIIGHAIGDALGVPVEFKSRKSLNTNPVTNMIGFGTYPVPAGTWSDDTSMEIALMASICENKTIDYVDIMEKFSSWYYEDFYTATGKRFDAGGTCANAIGNFRIGTAPLACGLTDIRSNGNGSLMRILPIAYICYEHRLSYADTYRIVKDVSSLTHRHEISILGCYIYVQFVKSLLMGMDSRKAYENIKTIDYSMFSRDSLEEYNRILDDNIDLFNINQISSTSYVVSTLEAALWCVLNNSNYRNTVLTAVNLGSDTDTIGAVAGSIAGIEYGISGIPKEWRDELKAKQYLLRICGDFADALPIIRL